MGQQGGEGQCVGQLPAGLVHYVCEMVVRPVSGEDRVQESSSLADAVIDLLGGHAVHSLATLVLKSPTFRQFKTGKIHAHLKTHLKSAEMAVAFALLTIEMGESGLPELDSARSFLQSVPAIQMSEVLIRHHPFLLDEASAAHGTPEADEFSEFACLVRDSCPDTFVEVLTSLIKTNQLSLNHVLNMFISSFVSHKSHESMSVGGSGNGGVTHNTAMLQLFLETYFTELLADAESAKPHHTARPPLPLDSDQVQALHTLVRSYLTSLTVPVRFVERN